VRRDQERDFDDFLAAKKHLAVELQLDDFVQDISTEFLRDECQPEEREGIAKELVTIAKSKDNPAGWLRSVIQSGKALAAIRAVASATHRANKRDDGVGATKHELQRELRQLFEDRNGPLKDGSKLLTHDGGMEWKDFAKHDPHMGKAIQSWLQKRAQEMSYKDADGYSFTPPISASLWRECLEEFKKATHGMREAGILD
jgi:hypothetical protein